MKAIISDCGRYRYLLRRSWCYGNGTVSWILLNPSTADAQFDDPTIRRCIRFSQRWGYANMEVVNLFALRSTDPSQLRTVSDPVGPNNDNFILKTAQGSAQIVLGWGNNGSLLGRDISVLRLLQGAGVAQSVLELTKSNAPKHPLYIKSDTIPIPYVFS